MTLDKLAIKHGTDKSSLSHAYTGYYSHFFEPIRKKEIRLLEIGVAEGNSLRMWAEYFPNAYIEGWDINDCSAQNSDRIVTKVVNQSDAQAMFREDKAFDIIVEDGSHEATDQILTFEIMFDLVERGEFYCCEDTLCSYDKERWGKNASWYDRVRKMVGEVSMNGKMSNYHLCSNKIKEAPKYPDLDQFEASIEWVFVSSGLTIIKKM